MDTNRYFKNNLSGELLTFADFNHFIWDEAKRQYEDNSGKLWCDLTFDEQLETYTEQYEFQLNHRDWVECIKFKDCDDSFELVGGELRVPTMDGYIRVTPKKGDGNPGIYVDLVSERISEENIGSTERNGISLAVIESYENSEDNNHLYKTFVWEDGKEEIYTHMINHKIVLK